MVDEVGYPKESVMPSSDMGCSTVFTTVVRNKQLLLIQDLSLSFYSFCKLLTKFSKITTIILNCHIFYYMLAKIKTIDNKFNKVVWINRVKCHTRLLEGHSRTRRRGPGRSLASPVRRDLHMRSRRGPGCRTRR